MPVASDKMRLFVAAAVLAAVAACQPSTELALREAAQPAVIATAMCSQYRPHDAAACDRFRLPERGSEVAYAECLEYNRRDLKRCGALRLAYEADLHAYLDAERPRSPAPPPAETVPDGNRSRVLRSTAAELFKASDSDADTFEAALLIPDVRRKIEAALHQRLTDDQLRTLVKKTRAEARYWYAYSQELDRMANR